MKNNATEKTRNRFAKFFERIDLRDEKKIVTWGKRTIFTLLIIVELLIFVQMFDRSIPFVSPRFWVALGGILLLTVVETLKLFFVTGKTARVFCYVFDFTASFAIIASSGGSQYLSVLFMLVLTEFYISERTGASILMVVVSLPLYVAAVAGATAVWTGAEVSYLLIISDSMGALILLLAHFFIINFALGFYRQYLRLEKALCDLDESNARLEKAYVELAKQATLEERQRIAKDIHDTAGHSITTVIMQTEAAKLIVEKDPLLAKEKIIAANLQAKSALEELRESVHLLSGNETKSTLKLAMQAILNESSDGTGITVRSDIDEIETSDERYRFLCNTLREGISNGIRHGGATAFWLEVKETDGGISFLLSDNGSGVDMKQLKKGFGLTTTAEHAKRLGGRMQLQSEVGEGFEIHIVLEKEYAKD